MSIEQRNRPILNKKEFQQMGLVPTATVNAAFVASPQDDVANIAMYVTSATSQFLYHHDEDGFVQITSAALTGTFGPGAAGIYNPWSITFTANGGSTTTLTVAAGTHNITGVAIGQTVEVLTGTPVGERRIITRLLNNAGAGTITLTVDRAFSAAIANTNTFRLSSGRFYVISAGTLAAGSFRVFDVATMAWQANLSITGLPATLGTDGKFAQAFIMSYLYDTGSATSGSTTTLTDTTKAWTVDYWKGYFCNIIDGTGEGQLVKILSNTSTVLTFETAIIAPAASSIYEIKNREAFAVGVATSATSTTLVNSAKAWATNQWANSSVRIVSGLGVGQSRLITSNTGTTLTVPTWTTTPDSTSVYEIEGDENSLYYLGNNAVTMYRYNISANTWATVAPGVARAGAPGVGMTANWVGITYDSVWGDENNILDGRYIYSFRGNGTANLDRYDIAANTWAAVVYTGAETFTTGSSADVSGRYIYIRKDATNRFFKYSVRGNYIEPVSTNFFPDGGGILGTKIWVKYYDPNGIIKWLYSMMNSGQVLHRIMLY